MFCKKGVLRNCKFCEISKNTFSHRTPPVAASVNKIKKNIGKKCVKEPGKKKHVQNHLKNRRARIFF